MIICLILLYRLKAKPLFPSGILSEYEFLALKGNKGSGSDRLGFKVFGQKRISRLLTLSLNSIAASILKPLKLYLTKHSFISSISA